MVQGWALDVGGEELGFVEAELEVEAREEDSEEKGRVDAEGRRVLRRVVEVGVRCIRYL